MQLHPLKAGNDAPSSWSLLGMLEKGAHDMRSQTRLLVNEQITIPVIRVVDEEYNDIGVMSVAEGIHKARSLGKDLVLVAPKANPPICRTIHPDHYSRDTTYFA